MDPKDSVIMRLTCIKVFVFVNCFTLQKIIVTFSRPFLIVAYSFGVFVIFAVKMFDIK